MATNDAVEYVPAGPTPCSQEETARRRVFFTVQRFQERHQFITECQHSVRVVSKNLAERLVGAVVCDIAAILWRFRLVERQRFDGISPISERLLRLGACCLLFQLVYLEADCISLARFVV
jgi:hypothetical protein